MNKKVKVQVESGKKDDKKVVLKATKVGIVKTGMNSGIVGGGYQCC